MRHEHDIAVEALDAVGNLLAGGYTASDVATLKDLVQAKAGSEEPLDLQRCIHELIETRHPQQAESVWGDGQ